nr:mu-like prophage Flumu protein gp36 [uncultured bacterium]
MSYNTLEKVKKLRISEEKLIMLTDDLDLGIIDAETAAGVITGGDALIDSYLRGRLLLPLNPVPDLIPELALDIYAYGFYSLKPEFEMPKTIGDRYAATIKTLQLIQKGDVKLGAAEIETPTVGGAAGAAQYSGNEREMSRAKLKGF